MQYQDRDWEIVDYQGYVLEDSGGYDFRGPKPKKLENNNYFVCIGAAQTFGCFCEKPYPTLLQEKLNFPVLNLGMAGAGPAFFLQNKQLLEYINRAKFAIVQVMSGRSEDNSLFKSAGKEVLTRLTDGQKIGAEFAYKQLLKSHPHSEVRDLIIETRENWVKNFIALLQQIKIPKILFWFSTREPFYVEEYTDVQALLGRFPQLINLKMVNEIKQYSDDYIQCITSRGMPQLMISRFTKKPTVIDPKRDDLRLLHGTGQQFNKYYPSPEMQIDAAISLEKISQKYLNLAKVEFYSKLLT